MAAVRKVLSYHERSSASWYTHAWGKLGKQNQPSRCEEEMARSLEKRLCRQNGVGQTKWLRTGSAISVSVSFQSCQCWNWYQYLNFIFSYVWPWAKSIAISHDSYTCKSYPYTQAWPVQRINEPNNFVASVVQENHTLWQPCPKACRPKNHLDWKYC